MEWVSKELAHVGLGDVRLDLRLMRIVEQMAKHAEQSLPEMSWGSWAETKAAYRFWSNDRIKWREILTPHLKRTAERAQAEPVVLVIQDNTEIDLSSHPATKGLGYLASARARGLLAHTCLAVSETGVPLGVVDLMLWTRPLEQIGKRYHRSRPTAEKESQRWLDGLAAIERALPEHPHLVVVADREADFYDLFAASRPSRIDLLVRICREARSVNDPSGYLKQALAATPWAGELVVHVPRSRKHVARQAHLRVRFTTLTILPPNDRRHHRGQQIPLSFVVVEEIDPPSGEKPIRWVLATTVAVMNLEQACRVVSWYARRWTIERFHYTLKSGYGVERQQLESLANVERFAATLAIVAWRLLWLTYEAREHPNAPCTIILDRAEWETLDLWTHRKHPQPLSMEPPTLGAAVQMIARLGGHLSRTRDGPPGVKTLWRGLARLSDLTEGYLLATHPP